MNSVFSVDEIDNSFFIQAAEGELAEVQLGRSQSEWALHSLLEEVSSSSSTPNRLKEVAGLVFGDGKPDQSVSAAPPIDPEECHTFLKSRLDIACAAFARSRESAVNSRDSVCFSENCPQVLVPLHLTTLANGSSLGASMMPHSASNEPLIPMMAPIAPIIQRNPSIQVKQATNESSKVDSEDDELEGDTGTTENPAEERRMRRMQSNRESARRSRRKKQDHMNELETQVCQLKAEHTTLLKRLTDMNHKYDEASIGNRILKADTETLRAKVKMAEETVKHATGINPLLLAMSNLSSADVSFINSPIDPFPATAPAMSPNSSNNHFFHPVGPNISNSMNSHHPGLDNNFLGNDSNPVAGTSQNDAVGIASTPGVIPGWNSSVPQSYADANPEHK